MAKVFRFSVNVPSEFLDKMMDAITEAIESPYPGYERAFGYAPVTGTWRSLEGSNPYKGKIGEIEVADEIRMEFIVREKDLKVAVAAIRRVHPYEEPAIDIVEMVDWHSLQ